MIILHTYHEFLQYMEMCGFMAFSGSFPAGLPVLSKLTAPQPWHTGNPETDPWQWKDRAAQEKRLAFGNILGGHKGFITEAMYPLFYSACRPDGDIEERFRKGSLKHTVYDVYRLFEKAGNLDTSEIRKAMNVTKKDGASAIDTAITLLQKEFYISVCGNRRKVGADGLEYGWPANVYCRTDDWAAGWLKSPLLPTAEARARILDYSARFDASADIPALKKLLF